MSFCFSRTAAVAVQWRVPAMQPRLLRAHRCSSDSRGIRVSQNVFRSSAKSTNAAARPTFYPWLHRLFCVIRREGVTSLRGAPPGTSLETSTSAACRNVCDRHLLCESCETYSGLDCRRAAVAVLRRSSITVKIRVLQGACLPVGTAAICSSIAICTSCLLPWYLPQPRSR